MIFCQNECIGVGSGEGEGLSDRCATRTTHAAAAVFSFPPFGNRFKTFRGKLPPTRIKPVTLVSEN